MVGESDAVVMVRDNARNDDSYVENLRRHPCVAGKSSEVMCGAGLRRPWEDERLNDIVGSAYYVAPEVIHKVYSTEADFWMIGVKVDPSFGEPWPSLSDEAKEFC
ncbi:hypothetical protein KIW84_065860 [Lathyrus oleraceus]|uniref:Protein kinase domain-containing protein n=1 Tax=Pisum sativum TaxID=3888 RepID=A0A9D4WHZ7_PEA|nr:hypothetical protein KIW84_065860 [Pisum sativum]